MTTTDPAALSVSASPRIASGSEPARSASTEMGSSVPGGAEFGDCPLSVSDLDPAPADDTATTEIYTFPYTTSSDLGGRRIIRIVSTTGGSCGSCEGSRGRGGRGGR